MAGNMRCIIIYHPDFDKDAPAGISEAVAFAETLLAGQKEMIAAAERSGEPAENITEIRKHAASYTIAIRKLDNGVIQQ